MPIEYRKSAGATLLFRSKFYCKSSLKIYASSGPAVEANMGNSVSLGRCSCHSGLSSQSGLRDRPSSHNGASTSCLSYYLLHCESEESSFDHQLGAVRRAGQTGNPRHGERGGAAGFRVGLSRVAGTGGDTQ